MATIHQWKKALSEVAYDAKFIALYANRADGQRERYLDALDQFRVFFGERDNILCVTAPGRTEIGGNHTDHNHGKVLTGAVNLDVLAIVSATDKPVIRIQSKGHAENRVHLDELAVQKNEYGHSNALIRGIAAQLKALGHNIGGFVAYTTSDVTSGSGLSSSAAFEILVGSILNHLYNNGSIDREALAKTGQFAENVYFGKPSGLLDQMGSVCGGLVAIDFGDINAPAVTRLAYDFAQSGHALCITAAGGSHADLTDFYAAIPREMKAVAAFMGHEVLRPIDVQAFHAQMADIRASTGDRALLRAMHFFNENNRVDGQVDALQHNDFDRFLALVRQSGYSSFMYNQNIATFTDARNQEVALALAVSEQLLDGRGATRVHGGGFAGTIQAFVPNDLLAQYQAGMDAVLGKGRCMVLSIRPEGPVVWTCGK